MESPQEDSCASDEEVMQARSSRGCTNLPNMGTKAFKVQLQHSQEELCKMADFGTTGRVLPGEALLHTGDSIHPEHSPSESGYGDGDDDEGEAEVEAAALGDEQLLQAALGNLSTQLGGGSSSVGSWATKKARYTVCGPLQQMQQTRARRISA